MAKNKKPTRRWITKSEFAEHRGKSRQSITYYLKTGKLKGSTKVINGEELVDWKKADKLLAERLDPIQVQAKAQSKKKPKLAGKLRSSPRNVRQLVRPGLMKT